MLAASSRREGWGGAGVAAWGTAVVRREAAGVKTEAVAWVGGCSVAAADSRQKGLAATVVAACILRVVPEGEEVETVAGVARAEGG